MKNKDPKYTTMKLKSVLIASAIGSAALLFFPSYAMAMISLATGSSGDTVKVQGNGADVHNMLVSSWFVTAMTANHIPSASVQCYDTDVIPNILSFSTTTAAHYVPGSTYSTSLVCSMVFDTSDHATTINAAITAN